MTLAKLHLGPNDGKRKLTTLELLLIAGFILFLAYMSLEPLVLPASATPQPHPAIAAVPAVPAAAPAEPVVPVQAAAPSAEPAQAVAEQKAAVPAEPLQAVVEQKPAAPAAGDTIKPIFVVTPNSTVLERIAPVATVTIEALAVPGATAEAPAVTAPAAPATPEPAKVEAAPAPAPAPVAVQTAPVVAEAPKAAAALRFEISDATGVDGFGKNVAQALEQSGVAIAKVASVSAGKQRRNVVLYRDGFEGEAKRLARLFINAPALVNNTASRDSADTADVKLVLGTAAAREKNLLASDGGVPKLSLGRLARSH